MKKKNKGHSNFMGKVHALMAKGFPEENAKNIVGAMVRDARAAAGAVSKKAKAARKKALKRAHAVHAELFKH